MAWKTVPLREVLSVSIDAAEIEPTATYPMAGVYSFGRGLFTRGPLSGAETTYKRFHKLSEGMIVLSQLKAWEGAIAVVGTEHAGCFLSTQFPTFRCDTATADVNFIAWFLRLPSAWESLRLGARGMGARRDSVSQSKFLELEIPLPSLDEQHVIARCLDSISAGVIEASKLADAALADLQALVFSLHESLSEPEPVSLGSLIELDERIEAVDDDGEYPQLGIRSFGNGLFFKDAVRGTETSYKKFNTAYQGGLIVSQPKGWEGAIAVATADHEGRYLSPEYRTFRCSEAKLAPDYLAALIVTPWLQHALSKMTKGQGARRERLRPEMLLAFELQMPKLAKQKQALKIIAKAQEVSKRLAMRRQEMSTLLPAMLHQIFEKKSTASAAQVRKAANVVSHSFPSGPSAVDAPFKEAVLVGAIIKAFHEEGGQPLGNFRLQKAVYFARRFMGECALDQQYLRKAAGPYNPSMRYSGGMKIALEKDWIAPANGQYGPGHSPGSAFDDAESWIAHYQHSRPAAWVRDKFKFKQNNIWELLATVDYAMLALIHAGQTPDAKAVLEYINVDAEWQLKVAKLGLTEAGIQNAMVELETLFIAS